MTIVIRRPAVEPAYIESDAVQRTVKLIGKERAAITDVLMLIQSQGIKPDEVVGVCRGAPGDPAFYVNFTSEEPVAKMRAVETLSYRKISFSMVAMGSQIVTLRVHWLPLFISDNLIKSVLADFGHVISVDRAESRGLHNGVRVVQLEVSEEERLALPHLVQFACGTTMLMTMPGRPPLCLRCQGLGHVRRDCPLTQRSFADVVNEQRPVYQSGHIVSQEPPQQPQEQEQPVRQPQQPLDAQSESEQDVSQAAPVQQQEPEKPVPQPRRSLDSSIDSELFIDETPRNNCVDDMLMEVVKPSLKRGLSEGETDSFNQIFPRQKVGRSANLDIGNGYQVLEGLSALLEETNS